MYLISCRVRVTASFLVLWISCYQLLVCVDFTKGLHDFLDLKIFP